MRGSVGGMSPERGWVIAVDIGGTQIRTALCDRACAILKRAAVPTPQSGAEALEAQLEGAIRAVWPEEGSPAAIGVAATGPVDPWSGVILRCQNIAGCDGYPLRARIESVLGVPTVVGKDTNLAALAEWRLGAGRGKAHMVYLTISTGIGSGIIVDNRLLLGAHGIAAEAGCMILEPDGPPCTCGSHRGCLEALASGWAIARDARARLAAGEPSILAALVGGELAALSAKTVHEAARAGDGLALDILRRAGRYIGLGLINLAHLFNPEVFIIGGSVSKAGELLLGPAREALHAGTISEHFWRQTPIVAAALGDDVGLAGAALEAWDAAVLKDHTSEEA